MGIERVQLTGHLSADVTKEVLGLYLRESTTRLVGAEEERLVSTRVAWLAGKE